MQLVKKTLVACLLLGTAIAAPLPVLETAVAKPLAPVTQRDIGWARDADRDGTPVTYPTEISGSKDTRTAKDDDPDGTKVTHPSEIAGS